MSGQSEVRNKAIQLLARREHGVAELTAKLMRQYNDEVTVSMVIKQLVEENLLSDDRYTECYVRSYIQKGQGPFRIKNALKEKGVNSHVINQYMVYDYDFWLSQIHKIHQKKFSLKIPENEKEKSKQIRFLIYRGFSHEQINGFYSDLNKINA